jgi:pimeloyl-ACP methyl ester carboxylesterase
MSDAVIIVPGLGDDHPLSQTVLKHATSHWYKAGLDVLIHPVHWRDGEPFQPKLKRLLATIDATAQKKRVSLVGTSAGASLAFSAFSQRLSVVHKAVNVCGRLRAGNHYLRSLARMARTSHAFYEAVTFFEKKTPILTSTDRRRLMTIRPFFGDQLVPHDTANLDGAHNRWVYTAEHMLGIYLSLKLSNPIIEFLKQK